MSQKTLSKKIKSIFIIFWGKAPLPLNEFKVGVNME